MTEVERVIKNSMPHAIVQMLYHCERINNYSDSVMIEFLKNSLTYKKLVGYGT